MRRVIAVIAVASSLLAVGGVTTSAGAAPEGALATAACNPGGKDVKISVMTE